MREIGAHLRPVGRMLVIETLETFDLLPVSDLPASRRLGRMQLICFWNSVNEIALSPSVSCLKNSADDGGDSERLMAGTRRKVRSPRDDTRRAQQQKLRHVAGRAPFVRSSS